MPAGSPNGADNTEKMLAYPLDGGLFPIDEMVSPRENSTHATTDSSTALVPPAVTENVLPPICLADPD